MDKKSKDTFIRISRESEFFTFNSQKKIHARAIWVINSKFYERIFRKYQRVSLYIQLSLYFLHLQNESEHPPLKVFNYMFYISLQNLFYNQHDKSSHIPVPAKFFIQMGIPKTVILPDKGLFSGSNIVNTFMPLQYFTSTGIQRKTNAFNTSFTKHLNILLKLLKPGWKSLKHESGYESKHKYFFYSDKEPFSGSKHEYFSPTDKELFSELSIFNTFTPLQYFFSTGIQRKTNAFNTNFTKHLNILLKPGWKSLKHESDYELKHESKHDYFFPSDKQPFSKSKHEYFSLYKKGLFSESSIFNTFTPLQYFFSTGIQRKTNAFNTSFTKHLNILLKPDWKFLKHESKHEYFSPTDRGLFSKSQHEYFFYSDKELFSESKHEYFSTKKIKTSNWNTRFTSEDNTLSEGDDKIFGSKIWTFFEKKYDVVKGLKYLFNFLDIHNYKISMTPFPEKNTSQAALPIQSLDIYPHLWQFNSWQFDSRHFDSWQFSSWHFDSRQFSSESRKKANVFPGKWILTIPNISLSDSNKISLFNRQNASTHNSNKIVTNSINLLNLFNLINDSIITLKSSLASSIKDFLLHKKDTSHLKLISLLESHQAYMGKTYNEKKYNPEEANHIKTISEQFHYSIAGRLKGFFSKPGYLTTSIKNVHYNTSKRLEEFFSKYIFHEGSNLEGSRKNDKNINQFVLNSQAVSLPLPKGPLGPRNINNFSDLIYLPPGKTPASSDPVQRPQEEKVIEYKKDVTTYETKRAAPETVPDINMYSLTDKVYRLIFERIKREKELRGR